MVLTLACKEEILGCPLNVGFLMGTTVPALSRWSGCPCSSSPASLASGLSKAEQPPCYSMTKILLTLSVFLKKMCSLLRLSFPSLVIYLSSFFLKLQLVYGFYSTVPFSCFDLFLLYNSRFEVFILICGEH